MSYQTDETSVAGSRPIDLYTIVTSSTTYRLTSYSNDVVFGGQTFIATTMDRGAITMAQNADATDMIVTLPITHPLVQRYCAIGVPEQNVFVTMQRLQSMSGVAIQQASGFAQGMTISGRTALLRVPSQLNDALKIQLPVIVASRLCNHMLFDGLCSRNPGIDGPSRTSFQVVTSVVSQAIAPGAITLNIATMGGQPDQWAQFGEVAIGNERRICISQLGAVLLINEQFVGIGAGTAVIVYGGCDHSNITCRDKYANIANFGGHPVLLSTNISSPTGLGIQVS